MWWSSDCSSVRGQPPRLSSAMLRALMQCRGLADDDGYGAAALISSSPRARAPKQVRRGRLGLYQHAPLLKTFSSLSAALDGCCARHYLPFSHIAIHIYIVLRALQATWLCYNHHLLLTYTTTTTISSASTRPPNHPRGLLQAHLRSHNSHCTRCVFFSEAPYLLINFPPILSDSFFRLEG